MKKKRHIWVSAIVLAAALVLLAIDHPATRILANVSYDAFQRIKPRSYLPAPVRIIAIDENSLEKYGQWPWPRALVARLVERLHRAGAAVIAFDMVFAERDRTSPASLKAIWPGNKPLAVLLDELPDPDDLLGRTIAEASVVTGFTVSDETGSTTLPQKKARFVVAGDDPKLFLPAFSGAVANLPRIAGPADGNGAFNFMADYDGVIRRVPLMVNSGGTLYPTLAIEALRVARGGRNLVVKSSGASGENRFGGHTGLVAVRLNSPAGNLVLPTDPQGQIWLHYSDTVPQRYLPAWRVLDETAAASRISGSICIIGVTAKGHLDLRFSPLGLIPGVEVHAQLAEQLLQGTFLRIQDGTKAAVMLMLIALWAVLAFFLGRVAMIWAVVSAAALLMVIFLSSWIGFIGTQRFSDPLFPALSVTAMFITSLVPLYLAKEREQKWIRAAFSSYVSPNLVQHLLDHPKELVLGGEMRECTFVMTDLQGFTTLMEQAEPTDIARILNGYIDEMLQIAFRHDGTLDRIVGDAVAVMFSAPVQQTDHARRAVTCALEMNRFAEDYAQKQQAEGIPFGITRIGVHSGSVLIGNFGGKTLFDYRALGDPINTAARLESVNKQIGTKVCISGSTVAQCAEFIGRPIGTLVLKGKTRGIETFEPLTETEFESPRITGYLKAFELLAAGDDSAAAAFAALVRVHPEDQLARFHHQRLQEGQSGVTVVLKAK